MHRLYIPSRFKSRLRTISLVVTLLSSLYSSHAFSQSFINAGFYADAGAARAACDALVMPELGLCGFFRLSPGADRFVRTFALIDSDGVLFTYTSQDLRGLDPPIDATIIEYRYFFEQGCPPGQEEDAAGRCIRLPIVMAKNPAICSGAPNEGNPINVATGNKYQLETDFVGAGDFPLAMRRHYNSLKSSDILVGEKWRHDYECSLSIDLAASPATISVNRADGVVFTFTQQNNLWVSDADVTETLVQTANGFIYTTENNLREAYDSNGRLLSMTNTRNQAISLSYNSTNGLLETVTGPFGRTLSFSYDNSGRLTAFDDPEGNVYRYEYDNNSNLAKVIYPDDTPSDLTDNPQRLYLYEDVSFLKHLTGIIDETGARFASWGYDDQGRGVFSEHNNGTERVDIVSLLSH